MSYTTISNFGAGSQNNEDPSDAGNPLTYCLVDSMSVQFMNGPTSSRYSPRCKECQSFMRLRCAGKYDKKETWDKYCKFYYENNKHLYTSPTEGSLNLASVNVNMPVQLSFGEQLLHNAVEEKYLFYPYRKVDYEPFDPNVPNSPYISSSCNGICNASYSDYVVKIEKKGLDKDPLMNELLKNPKAAYDVLARIHDASKKKKVNISGTKLKKWIDSNKKLLETVFDTMVASNPYLVALGEKEGQRISNRMASAGCGCSCDANDPHAQEGFFDLGLEESCKIIEKAGLKGPCEGVKIKKDKKKKENYTEHNSSCGSYRQDKKDEKKKEYYTENLVNINGKYAKNLCQGCGCK